MAKFNRPGTRARVTGSTTTTGPATTYEGGAGFTRDSRSELVMLAVVNMVGESTFYEAASERDSRFATLCQEAAVSDGAWYLAFVRWLRGEANMRSAALVAAAVGVKARLSDLAADEVPESEVGLNRKIVDAVLQRADEPGEFLAYWHTHYGRTVPMPVKRGLGDAARRLYNERSLLKYDTATHAVRFADVLDLAHPDADPAKPWQGDVFTYALHRRHGYPDQIPERLSTVRMNRELRANKDHGGWLNPDVVRDAGMTWEDVLSALGSKVDKAKLWESMIPSMGYMALLRNLRNFDQAGVPDNVAARVIAKLTDPEAVVRSRQFPYRFLSAYRAAPSLRWGHALETALNMSLVNLPTFRGNTLIMIDTSASMRNTVSDKSQVRHVDVAMLTATALAHRSSGRVDLVGFADYGFSHPITKGGSVLREIDRLAMRIGEVGHGTNTAGVLSESYNGHDRVVIVHDGQFGHWRYSSQNVSDAVPATVPLYSIDTSGYQASPLDTSRPNRFEVGGFSDKLFTMISLLDQGRNASWPWEVDLG